MLHALNSQSQMVEVAAMLHVLAGLLGHDISQGLVS